MGSFSASTQYGDWNGTASADNAGSRTNLREYLGKKKLINDGEFLLAVSFYDEEDFVSVTAFVTQGNSFDSVKESLGATEGPIPVREIELQMKPKDFLELFKRFHAVLTHRGLGLEGREYSVPG